MTVIVHYNNDFAPFTEPIIKHAVELSLETSRLLNPLTGNAQANSQLVQNYEKVWEEHGLDLHQIII